MENKVKELDQLHKRHLSRPTLDDTDEEEKTIDKLTQETTSVRTKCLTTGGVYFDTVLKLIISLTEVSFKIKLKCK